jgi:benzoyl-CoA reductase/2-hydroxyglutaryl-CoA dehydratase subunit BcrC/BadD/HgdB
MSDNQLPAIFESFADARKQGFITMKNLKDSGKKVAGTFCSYVPVELFMAADMVYVGLCSTSDETIADAERTLPRNLCPLIKSSYGFAVTQKCPYMYFSDIVIGETTCDGKKKMFELLAELKDVHVMQLPNTQSGQGILELWENEIRLLAQVLEEKFGVEITEQKLKAAITQRNAERRLLADFSALSKQVPPPLTGLEQLKVLFGAQFKFSHDEKMAEVSKAFAAVQENAHNADLPVSSSAKRIVITGCPIGGVTEKVVAVIEECGGVVVAYENCTGAKQYDRLVDESKEPYRALAERYLDIGCAVMSPDQNRYELLDRLITEYQADAVIEMTLVACQPYNIETASIRQNLDAKGVPFLSIETDYSTSDLAQLKTRVGAFIETLL